MSIFGSIMSKIFGGAAHAEGASASAVTSAGGGAGAPASAPSSASSTSSAGLAGAAGAPSGTRVDVDQVVSGMAAKKGEKLNYQSSIVDLMKLLDLDASLANRKELATELGYTGAKDGSAEMNIWLHKRVVEELEKNGGKVSAAMKD